MMNHDSTSTGHDEKSPASDDTRSEDQETTKTHGDDENLAPSATDYKRFPALAAYVERIRAEQTNFKTFMVKEYGSGSSYYRESATIRIQDDGTINCSKPEYAPTPGEAAAIKAELEGAAISFPKPVEASSLDSLFDQHPEVQGTQLFEVWNRQTGLIAMVQQRVDLRDGRKFYVPWSGWSDGQWRKMEPGGSLRFSKPRKKRSNLIMVHEGAKAAAAVEKMIAERSDHPWIETLRLYEHWGLLTGAGAPHRADFAELRGEQPAEVAYVCDNDGPGNAVLQVFARHYRGKLYGIRFDSRWPLGWDMADPMPEAFFRTLPDGTRVCGGPRLDELDGINATWATKIILPKEKGGRPSYKITDDFRDEWFHCVTPEVFIERRRPHKLYTQLEFNHVVGSFSDVDDTGKFLKKIDANGVRALHYRPAEKPGLMNAGTTGGDGMHLNVFRPSDVKPVKGDPTPWLEYLAHLIPVERDRHELQRWCATLIVRLDIKMQYGVLLVSETQGVGKSTLGEKILGPIVGQHNTSVPDEGQLVNPNYNYWVAHKRLVICHEVYAADNANAYNRLKSAITDKIVMINKKYQAPYEIECFVNVIASSNSMRALSLPNEDRRWFVPKITDQKLPREYWTRFNQWLTEENGLGIIRWWAEEWLKSNAPVMQGDPAPDTQAKQEMIEAAFSPRMQLVADWLDDAKAMASKDPSVDEPDSGKPVVTTTTSLVELIKARLYEGRMPPSLEKPRAILKLAENRGWAVNKKKRVQMRPLGDKGYLLASHPGLIEAENVTWREIRDREGVRALEPNDVCKF